MKSVLPKVNTLSFTEFQAFFSMERFIDRGVPVVITFSNKGELTFLQNIKKIIRSSYTNDPFTTISGESFQSRLLLATREATNLLMSESLFTMCLQDFVAPMKHARKTFVIDKSPCQQILSFTDEKVKYGCVSNDVNVIPLSMSKLFSMSISVVLEDSLSRDDAIYDVNGITWETARSKTFANKYIIHNAFLDDFCNVFRSKNVYTFIQKSNEIVIFPPSCAKQGKVGGKINCVAMWSVHNIISLSLNNIIKDFSPTKSLDRRIALKQTIKNFLMTAIARKTDFKVLNEYKKVDFFIEMLMIIENMHDLADSNGGLRLCLSDISVPKVYAPGTNNSTCYCCGEATYGSAFFRSGIQKNDCVCYNCVSVVRGEIDDFVEVVFADFEDYSLCSANDREFLVGFHKSLLAKFDGDAQILKVLGLLEKIVFSFSDKFYFSRKSGDAEGGYGWNTFFHENIRRNGRINAILSNKEDIYKACIPIERFYESPVMFCLFVTYSFTKKEVSAFLKELCLTSRGRSSAFCEFIVEFITFNGFNMYKCHEKDRITLKLLEGDGSSGVGDFDKKGRVIDKYSLCAQNEFGNVVIDREQLSGLCIFAESGSEKEFKKRIIQAISPKDDDEEHFPRYGAKRKGKMQHDLIMCEPVKKRAANEIPKSVHVKRCFVDDGWLKKYVETKIYLDMKTINKVSEIQKKVLRSKMNFVCEEFIVNDRFSVKINNFCIDNSKRNKMFFFEFKENFEFLANVRFILNEVLTKISSFKVLLVNNEKIEMENLYENIEFINYFNKILLNKYDLDIKEDNKEKFSLDLFYKLLRTINNKTGNLLLLDIISFINKDIYGWVFFNNKINFPVLPYEKNYYYNSIKSVNIFGIDLM